MLTDTHGWMTRQKVIIIAHPEHSSGEVKKKAFYLELCSNSNTYEISKQQLHDIFFSDCSGKIGLGITGELSPQKQFTQIPRQ